MTGDDLFTHQLPRAGRFCGPKLLEQHPELADIVVSTNITSREEAEAWLVPLKERYGEQLVVASVADEWKHIDAIEEAFDSLSAKREQELIDGASAMKVVLETEAADTAAREARISDLETELAQAHQNIDQLLATVKRLGG